MSKKLLAFAVVMTLQCTISVAQQVNIYKIVDADGNVIFTDQVPADGSAPMDLPELSVIESDYVEEPTTPADVEAGAEAESGDAAALEPTPRELRRMYRDFRITRPAQEETFWGTENMVVVSWGSSTPLRAGMSTVLFVDGQRQANTEDNMAALTLDRGEHKVHAQLLDIRKRPVITTPIVTFFVQQNSVGRNQPVATPRNGN